MVALAIVVTTPIASAGTTPPAFDPMFTPYGVAKCDSLTGQWSVVWNVFTRSQVPSEVTAATDPATGAAVTIGASRVLPAGTTSTSVSVVAHRTGGSQSVTYQRTLAMGTCAPSTIPGPCVGRDGGRFAHTLDGATGTATVRLTGNRPCEAQFFVLWSTSAMDFRAYQVVEAAISGTTSAVAFQVALPSCTVKLTLLFGWPFATPDPTMGASVLGADVAPGNQSTGPLGRFTGTSPCASPDLTVTPRCAGGFDVTAVGTGSFPAEVHFNDGTPSFFVTAGEQFQTVVPPIFYHLGQGLSVTANGFVVRTDWWARPLSCPGSKAT